MPLKTSATEAHATKGQSGCSTKGVTCYKRPITLQHKQVQGAGAGLPPAGLQQLVPVVLALLVPVTGCSMVVAGLLDKQQQVMQTVKNWTH
jgi:hypothetical protein